jgi:ribosomal protein S14
MRKRSKIRLPQDVQPWTRVTIRGDEDHIFELFNRKPSRQDEGSKRDYNTALLQSYNTSSIPTMLLHMLLRDRQPLLQQYQKKKQLHRRILRVSKKSRHLTRFDMAKYEIKKSIRRAKKVASNARLSAISKIWSNPQKSRSMSGIKNFCLVLGKSRTYNRNLFISRQTVRKMTRVGLLSGIQK